MMRISLASLVILLLASACGDDDDGPVAADGGPPDAAPIDGTPAVDATPPDGGFIMLPEAPPGTPPAGDPTIKVATYNTGLIGSEIVKGHKERKPLIIAALKALDAEVLCLQEVYNNEEDSNSSLTNVGEFAASLADVYPHSFYSFQASRPLGSGLLIVSKHPLFRGRELIFNALTTSSIVDRGILGVNVLTADAYFSVLCTHMQSGLDDGGAQSSVQVRLAEIDELFNWADTEGYLDGPTFLLGDFNTGPDPIGACTSPGVPAGCCSATATPFACTQAADVLGYNSLLTNFTDENTNALGCTSCLDRFIPLQAITTFNNEPSQRIDHCLSAGIGTSGMTSSELVLDEPQTIAFNAETLLTLSDHDGVRCVYSP